jgi:hypothetical protein
MKTNRAYFYVSRINGIKDEHGLSDMGHWVRQTRSCQESYHKDNYAKMTQDQMVNFCKESAREIAKSILKEMRKK